MYFRLNISQDYHKLKGRFVNIVISLKDRVLLHKNYF